ncbi:ABC transporter permease [Mycoavidus sp. B2-EB]|uniref:ABC transporter permease n=1 Tax=Mycoavidus sp. B2-EB TaxID=2651972 RepID=UPI001626AC92|nr:ABC transporter permease [Mycoavidus sp. B2-EB]BBO59866.1 ABC transporter permease [Mycoavidus sp. B2-EB]
MAVSSTMPDASGILSASKTPWQRIGLRFKQNRLGYWSLILLVGLFALSLLAPLYSDDQPLLIQYEGKWYFPIGATYAETTFGGDFPTPADYLDPYLRQRLATAGNFALYPLNPYGYNTLNYFAGAPNPAPPSHENWLGTDDRGRDVLARLIYGFRTSLVFALALTALGTVLGVLAGALQGYFGGRFDLLCQRLLEIWGALPELYLLIIFASIFEPSLLLLVALLSLFGWLGLADYMRAEFLRNRTQDYVKAARAIGLSHWKIIWRHILPNSLTPLITFLPFRMSGAILALTSLDFLGLGVPATTPSLGELLAQGKANLDAWWISLTTFGVLVITLLLLSFIGSALRDALDMRLADRAQAAGGTLL